MRKSSSHPLFNVDISTFKGFLRNGRATAADFTRALHTALADIARFTVDGSDEELVTFRDSMLALAGKIHDQASTADVDATVSQAMELFRDYNSRLMNFSHTHTGELKAVMRTMTETITYLSESRTRSVHQLQFMERELEQASEIDDIRLLRTRIESCLEVVREETERLQSEAQTRSQQVREQIGRAVVVAESPPPRFGTMDPVTGLPSRRAAERSVTEALQLGNSYAIAVFVVNRLAAINSKYGRAVGDEVMLRVANHFAQHLSADTLLYRWSGPALVALINIHRNEEAIRNAWTKAAAVRQEITLEMQERSVFTVVETSIWFQVVNKETVPQDFFNSLDTYVADHLECKAD